MAVSVNLEEKVPIVDDGLSSLEQKIYPTTLLDGNCLWFELQADRNFYADLRQTFSSLKLKTNEVRSNEPYNHNECKKEQGDESKEAAAEDTAFEEKEEDPPAPLATHVRYVIHSIFPNVEVYINNQRIYNYKKIVCAQVLTFLQIQRSHVLTSQCEWYDMNTNNLPMKLRTLLCPNFFYKYEKDT